MNPSQTDVQPGLSAAATKLRLLITGYIVSRAVHVAAELDLASHLARGAKSGAELAALCGAHAPTLDRVMRLLVSVGVFAESNGRFTNNDTSELLRGDAPQSMRAWARMYGADFQSYIPSRQDKPRKGGNQEDRIETFHRSPEG
jgi:hypothetical protein